MLRLTLHIPGEGERTFMVEEGSVLLGRSSKCDFKILSHTVSKVHAQIRVLPDGVFIRDMGSRNGTEVNGQRIEEQMLRPGDDIMLGDVWITADPTSPVFQGQNPAPATLQSLLAQEQALKMKEKREEEAFERARPDQEAWEEAERQAQREARALRGRPLEDASGHPPVLRELRISEGRWAPRTIYRIRPFRFELDGGELVWIKPWLEVGVESLQGFRPRFGADLEEPEDNQPWSEDTIHVLSRKYYFLPERLKILDAEPDGRRDDGLLVYVERAPQIPITLAPVE